jgi:SynChlorMet cassette protein ScmD
MKEMQMMNEKEIQLDDKLTPNPNIVLREEFDDWAILFDPDTGDSLVLNPISVLIWKQLDGKNSLQDVVKVIYDSCENVPDSVEQDVLEFIRPLVAKGYAGARSDS